MSPCHLLVLGALSQGASFSLSALVRDWSAERRRRLARAEEAFYVLDRLEAAAGALFGSAAPLTDTEALSRLEGACADLRARLCGPLAALAPRYAVLMSALATAHAARSASDGAPVGLAADCLDLALDQFRDELLRCGRTLSFARSLSEVWPRRPSSRALRIG